MKHGPDSPQRQPVGQRSVCDTRPMPPSPERSRSRALRRDALENREKILRTAAELMARRGRNVPLSDIADAAGVGVGTFYRSFADRAALLGELQRRGCDLLLEALARIAADGLTGAEAIESYLLECLNLADQLVAMPLRGAEHLRDDAAIQAQGQVLGAIAQLLAQGRADGSIRDDVDVSDIAVCGTLIANPLPTTADWPSAARRHIETFVRGLRTDGGGR